MPYPSTSSRRLRSAVLAAVLGTILMGTSAITTSANVSNSITPDNGSIVYSPPNGSSFNDEGDDATGTAYAKILSLKHSGSANDTLIVTFDDARLIPDDNPTGDPTTDTQACLTDTSKECHQEWPIFESLDGGAS